MNCQKLWGAAGDSVGVANSTTCLLRNTEQMSHLMCVPSLRHVHINEPLFNRVLQQLASHSHTPPTWWLPSDRWMFHCSVIICVHN